MSSEWIEGEAQDASLVHHVPPPAVRAAAVQRVRDAVLRGRVVVFDVETTGFAQRDRVIELGAVEIVRGALGDGRFHSMLCPIDETPAASSSLPPPSDAVATDGAPDAAALTRTGSTGSASSWSIHPLAQRKHGLSRDSVLRAPPSGEVLRRFVDWVGAADALVAHNAPFDTRMLMNELSIARLANAIDPRKIHCSLEMFSRVYPGRPASLPAACATLAIPVDAALLHSALADAALTARLLLRLVGSSEDASTAAEETAAAAATGDARVSPGALPPSFQLAARPDSPPLQTGRARLVHFVGDETPREAAAPVEPAVVAPAAPLGARPASLHAPSKVALAKRRRAKGASAF